MDRITQKVVDELSIHEIFGCIGLGRGKINYYILDVICILFILRLLAVCIAVIVCFVSAMCSDALLIVSSSSRELNIRIKLFAVHAHMFFIC